MGVPTGCIGKQDYAEGQGASTGREPIPTRPTTTSGLLIGDQNGEITGAGCCPGQCLAVRGTYALEDTKAAQTECAQSGLDSRLIEIY